MVRIHPLRDMSLCDSLFIAVPVNETLFYLSRCQQHFLGEDETGHIL